MVRIEDCGAAKHPWLYVPNTKLQILKIVAANVFFVSDINMVPNSFAHSWL